VILTVPKQLAIFKECYWLVKGLFLSVYAKAGNRSIMPTAIYILLRDRDDLLPFRVMHRFAGSLIIFEKQQLDEPSWTKYGTNSLSYRAPFKASLQGC